MNLKSWYSKFRPFDFLSSSLISLPVLIHTAIHSWPPYSRVETHRRRATSRSPLGFRSDEKETSFSSLNRYVCSPMAASSRQKPRPRIYGLNTKTTSTKSRAGFPFVCQTPHDSVATVTSLEHLSNSRSSLRMCIQEEPVSDAVAMVTLILKSFKNISET